MAMPLVVAEDDGSVPRDAVRRRSSPDIRKLTMPLDLICLGVEILIISMRHHHHGMGRRVDSSSMEFLVLARRGASFAARPEKNICVCFACSRTLAWPGWRRRSAQQNFCHSPNRIHHQLPTPTLQLGKRRGRKKLGKKSRAQKCQSSETFRGTGQLPS